MGESNIGDGDMSRLVCYFTNEGGTAVCWQEMMGRTTIDCTTCKDREKHEECIKEYNR